METLSKFSRSLFAETDRPPDSFRSDKNPGESTAAECLDGAQQSLDEAVGMRQMAYKRFVEWADTVPGQLGDGQRLLKEIQEARRKRKDLDATETRVLAEYLIVSSDCKRGESEVAHWRELITWWRTREAMGWDRRYGASRSVSDLVRGLAEAKS